MGLKEVVLGFLGAGTILACDVDVPDQKNVEQPAQVVSSYNVVSVDELLLNEGENLLEIYAKPRGLCAWDYWLFYVRGEDENLIVGHTYGPAYSICNFLYDSLTPLIDEFRQQVRKKGPFNSLLLHSYDLTEKQRNEIATGLEIKKVAYVKTPPPDGVRKIDLAGVIITRGGGIGFSM